MYSFLTAVKKYKIANVLLTFCIVTRKAKKAKFFVKIPKGCHKLILEMEFGKQKSTSRNFNKGLSTDVMSSYYI